MPPCIIPRVSTLRLLLVEDLLLSFVSVLNQVVDLLHQVAQGLLLLAELLLDSTEGLRQLVEL